MPEAIEGDGVSQVRETLSRLQPRKPVRGGTVLRNYWSDDEYRAIFETQARGVPLIDILSALPDPKPSDMLLFKRLLWKWKKKQREQSS